jgi:hypothetical protein
MPKRSCTMADTRLRPYRNRGRHPPTPLRDRIAGTPSCGHAAPQREALRKKTQMGIPTPSRAKTPINTVF